MTLRFHCIAIAILLGTAGAHAGPVTPPRGLLLLAGTPALPQGDATIGCGLKQLATKEFVAKDLEAAGVDLKSADPRAVATLKGVYSWCFKPDATFRVWTLCKGSGDSESCALYVAEATPGKTSRPVGHAVGSSPPIVEYLERAATLWQGNGLKVHATSTKRDVVFGVYIDAHDLAQLKVAFTQDVDVK